jgi:hypothetical protein
VDTAIRLSTLNEKQCYADLELALTAFLLRGDEVKAASAVPAAFGKCHSRQPELTAILKWELHRLGSEVPEFSQRADEFVHKFLATSNPS